MTTHLVALAVTVEDLTLEKRERIADAVRLMAGVTNVEALSWSAGEYESATVTLTADGFGGDARGNVR